MAASVVMPLVAVALLLGGGLTLWRVVRGGRVYRLGPWPGLSRDGAAVLLGCALLLGGGQVLVGNPAGPLPELPLLAVLAVCPVAFATRLVGIPGAATAVCGAYLMPRTVLSLLNPSVEPPMLLLVPALAFDVAAWLRWRDLAGLRPAWPAKWRRHSRVTPRVTPRFYAGGGPCAFGTGIRRGMVGPRRGGWRRGIVAGASFGAVLAIVEPPFRVLLGGDPGAWDGPSVWLAGGLAALGCSLAAAFSGRGTAT